MGDRVWGHGEVAAKAKAMKKGVANATIRRIESIYRQPFVKLLARVIEVWLWM